MRVSVTATTNVANKTLKVEREALATDEPVLPLRQNKRATTIPRRNPDFKLTLELTSNHPLALAILLGLLAVELA